MTLLQALRYLLGSAPRSPVILLSGLMLLTAATEGVGILLLVPGLELLGGGAGMAERGGYLQAGLHWLGIPLELRALLALFVGLVVFRGAVQYGREQVAIRLQHRVVDDFRQRCFAALLWAEWRWLVNTRRSDHSDFLLADVGRIGVGLNQGLALLVTLVTLLAHLIVAAVLSWQMTLVALICGGGGLYLLAGQRRQALDLGDQLSRASRALQGSVQENLAGLKVTKILGAEQYSLDEFRQTAKHLRAQQLAFSASNSLAKALFLGGGALLLAAFLYVGLRLWLLPLSVLLTLVVIFGRLMPIMITGQQQLHHCLHSLPALRESRRLLAECQASVESRARPGVAQLSEQGSIALNDVGVQFADRRRPALRDISLTLSPGTTTAIIGPSGAGKSTLADVLTGLLVPDRGELKVDDRVIQGDLRQTWRSRVAYVPQEVFLFHASIRQNLVWACPTATDEDFRTALLRAAAGFVFDLPQGLDTVVGDGGERLSGGERQRIALARALLRHPQLLILDEATSALDRHNSDSVHRALESLHGDLIVVIIAHHLPQSLHIDQVVSLKSGQLILKGEEAVTWGGDV